MATVDTWRTYPYTLTAETLDQRYDAYWSLVDGQAFIQLFGRRQGVFKDQRVYRNTRLIYSHAPLVSDFYAAHTYMGQLATDGKRLPDGSRGAIPVDPQTGNTTTDEALLKAVSQWWNRCNWQDGMSLRPMYVSALGDGLTELVDDPDRHGVWPQFVWPGYVSDIELDAVNNLQAYTVEHSAERKTGKGIERFTFKRIMTKESFAYFRDGVPWDAYGEGNEVPNPYGFLPAIWDRYKKAPRSVRGISALSPMRQALYELNSTFSHGMDYQRKAFGAPIVIKGSTGASASQVIGPTRQTDPAAMAEQVSFMEVEATGGIEQLTFDVGKTLDMLKEVKNGILEVNPEANFYPQLRAMSTLTGPGAERALGDAVSRANLFRSGMDIQTVKLQQMAVAISGWRLNTGAWKNPTPRDEAFRPFGLDSYARGELDMTILDRPVIPETREERIAVLAMIEALQSEWALSEVGLGELADTKAGQNLIAGIRSDVQAASQMGAFEP
jgi:hypothetical protein